LEKGYLSWCILYIDGARFSAERRHREIATLRSSIPSGAGCVQLSGSGRLLCLCPNDLPGSKGLFVWKLAFFSESWVLVSTLEHSFGRPVEHHAFWRAADNLQLIAGVPSPPKGEPKLYPHIAISV